MKRWRSALFATLVALALPGAASASPVTINAGDIAQAFQLTLGAGLFTAYSTGSADSALYLFDADWHPIAANDDAPLAPPFGPGCPSNPTCSGATPPGSFIWDVTTGAPSVYHLVLAEMNANPLDQAGNFLFDQGSCGTGSDPSLPAGTCLPIAGEETQKWAGAFQNKGGNDGNGFTATWDLSGTFQGKAYDVTTTPEALPTPEPTSLFLFGTGAVGLVARLRGRKQSKA